MLRTFFITILASVMVQQAALSEETAKQGQFSALCSKLEEIRASKEKEKQDEVKKLVQSEFWKQAADLVKSAGSIQESNDLADKFMLISPLVGNLDNPEAAGKQLAKILYLPEDKAQPLKSFEDLAKYEKEIQQAVELERVKLMAAHYDYEAMERSIKHLAGKYPEAYKSSEDFLKQLHAFKAEWPNISEKISKATPADTADLKKLVDFRLNALYYANPEVDFEDFLAVRRFDVNGSRTSRHADRPANWQGITSMPGRGKKYQSDILSYATADVAKPAETILSSDRWLGHLDLDFDGKSLMYTSNNFDKDNKRPWDVFEFDLSSKNSTSLTGHMPEDTDSYDSCYLPDGRVLFINTSGYQGVPCVGGNDYVGNIHLLDRNKKTTRRLTLDQDNNWFPTMLHDGRVMFLRWEYTESAHYFSRILMHMNPDGTDQKEYYGSNSYWPNSLFNAKAIPGKPGMFVGIVSGHHGENRVGELVVFDINRGRKETQGAVQKIPGYGKEVPNITKDYLVNGLKTPLFAEPYPLSENYYLASSNVHPGETSMNIVFCDTFDNIIPLTSSRFFVHAEPRPLHVKVKPPIIPDRVNLESSTAIAYITDIYEGSAMEGVPQGEAKSLRVFMSEYSPRNYGSHYAMGMESNWDLKVLYGTTPINSDGSAMFEVPANQPITLQVLDGEGRALAWMRSWFTAMPGETLSCIGCHENQNEAPPAKMTIASRQKPAKLDPWYGEARTFSFLNEVQGVLDRNCIGCHNADTKKEKGVPDFATTEIVKGTPAPGGVSYWSLHPFVRRNGPEGDYTGLKATEFTTDTSELMQLLEKGHHGVKLNAEDKDRLITWIDMNVPYLGYWPGDRNARNLERRYELHKLYTTIERDYVTMDDTKYKRGDNIHKAPAVSEQEAVPASPTSIPEFPFEVKVEPPAQTIDLGNGVKMNLRQIPAGKFIMGSTNETPSELPTSVVSIDKPFWMGETEVTLEQYKQFDPDYENGWYDMHYKDQVKPGYNMNELNFPVIRVSWEKAMEFCKWLSEKTGKKVTLPTEAQWEYAARAGSAEAMPFGPVDSDFSKHANLADITIKELAVIGVDPKPMKNPNRFFDFVPRDENYNDGVLHLAPVGSYTPNAFHLYDMIGNVAEWTRTQYKPYPWSDEDGRNDVSDGHAPRVVRGGSWRDRPVRATSSWRWSYPGWRPVYNVGFRVIIED